ncbi:YaiO family outer membrane beta-barrel protein [Stenotrophomonas acidaminiphila]|uniref:YaiO family outer membrane beta-barrel protein n=1 Tax=Stenotrophomonas acidaminiphila TaxID=128780 RepID=UPI0028B0C083|nr:YaiO family outer membrane beta-barrel protein [Stenotrophomonas acidaminiphila]
MAESSRFQSTHRLLAQCLALALAVMAGPALAQDTAPDSLAAQMAQIRGLATGGQRAEAIERYTALLAEHPDNGDLLLARGRTYAWDGQYAAAEADLGAVVRNSPGYADAWSALGDLYRWSDRPQQAVDAYSHWVELAPQDPQARIARGRAQRDAGQAAAARADFDAALAMGADPAEVDSLRQSLLPRTANPDAMIAGGYRWGANVGWDHTGFSGGRQSWNDANLTLRRYFERGSLGLELLRADHFGRSDTAWALDGYAPLWTRAYANLRYQRGPSSGLLPKYAWRAEVFQGVGSGWELSASVDHLRFSSDTEFYGVGVGRYVGNWYGRYKLQHVPGAGSGSWSHRVLLRNYYRGDADDYWEVSAGTGRSTDMDRFGTVVRNSNAAVGVAWMHYFAPHWGLKLGAGYSDDDAGFAEKRVSLSVYSRW